MSGLREYLKRISTRVAVVVALALYLPLTAGTGAWVSPVATILVLVLVVLAPRWAQLINAAEARILLRWPRVTAGRAGRFLIQIPANLTLIWILISSRILSLKALQATGGLLATAVVVTAAGHGFQVLALRCANRGLGHRHRNVLGALAGTTGSIGLLPMAEDVPGPLLFLLFFGGALAVSDGATVLVSDLRSVRYPRGGIGLFFGTFNPMHTTHISMIEQTLRERRLDRVLVHPTVIPKLHAKALRRGEIVIAGREAGMRVYARTPKADRNVEYFPTGNRFLEHGTRVLLIRLSLRDAGLEDRVDVVAWRDIYAERGYYGVVAEIKRRYPGRALHGIHGSDAGGMWNRAIYDESGGIHAYPFPRVDAVSGTAIRDGARGMMTPTAEALFEALRRGATEFEVGGRRYVVADGEVKERL